MEKLNFKNVELDICPNYYDLKRVAEKIYANKELFVYIFGCKAGMGCLYEAPFFVLHNSMVSYAMPSELTTQEKVIKTVSNIRSAFKKRETESLNMVYDEFMKHPKDHVVKGLLEALAKLSPENQKKVISHIMGDDCEYSVNVEIYEPGEKQRVQSRKKYNYYIAFKNKRTEEMRNCFFENHSSAAIYAMHLIDRSIRGDKCTPIDITKNVELLKQVYAIMFADGDELKGVESGVVKDNNGVYHTEKSRLSQYYCDIDKKIGECIHEWEYISPYRCDAETYIALPPHNIIIPKNFIPFEWKINV